LKKLLQLLAFSAGGGLLLGAGFRLAEKQLAAADEASEGSDDRISVFLGRLEDLERRIDSKKSVWAETDSTAAPPPKQPEELQAELTAQIRGMEERLRLDLSHRHEERIASLGDAIEKRIEQRLGPLETEVRSQRTSVDELREYSLRTEKSLQKLLEGVDRLVAAQSSKTLGSALP
jgi:hypothetical protein